MEEKKYFSFNQIFVHDHGHITESFFFSNTNAQLNMPCSLYNLERLFVLRELFTQGNYVHKRYAFT